MVGYTCERVCVSVRRVRVCERVRVRVPQGPWLGSHVVLRRWSRVRLITPVWAWLGRSAASGARYCVFVVANRTLRSNSFEPWTWFRGAVKSTSEGTMQNILAL